MVMVLCHIFFFNIWVHWTSLAASTSAVEWYKSHAHVSFLSEVVQILMYADSKWTRYSWLYMYIYTSFTLSCHHALPWCIPLIHFSIHFFICGADIQHSPIDLSRGFWYGTLPCHMMFEGAKLLATSRSTVEWCKSCTHISFLFEVIQILISLQQVP